VTGSRGGGGPGGLGDVSPPVGSRDKAPVGSGGDEVCEKQNVKLVCNF